MLIEKVSLLTGKKNVMNINASPLALEQWSKSKGLVQDYFPYLSPEEREFLISGITPEEWNKYVEVMENE